MLHLFLRSTELNSGEFSKPNYWNKTNKSAESEKRESVEPYSRVSMHLHGEVVVPWIHLNSGGEDLIEKKCVRDKREEYGGR